MARPVHIFSVVPHRGINVIIINYNSIILSFLEIPCIMSKTTLKSAPANVISVVDNNFGAGHCFQLFPLYFQLLNSHLAVEILIFKAFDVLN